LKPFNGLLNSNHHCAGLPRRSSGTSSTLQKAFSYRNQFGSCIGASVRKCTIRRQAHRRHQALKMKSFMTASIALSARDLPFRIGILKLSDELVTPSCPKVARYR
jgi:hypothetical protein